MTEPVMFRDGAPHSRTGEQVLEELGVRVDRGLDPDEVRRRFEIYGPNELREHERESAWSILFRQFKGLVVALLAVAAVVSFAFGEVVEGAAILVVVLLNTAIAFLTAIRAVRSMEALRALGQTTTRARRDGVLAELPAEELVPGDVVLLEGGDVATADVRLVSASRLQADESALTGESLPVSKNLEPVAEDAPLAERKGMVFKGTSVTRGSAEAVVVETGMRTQLGNISSLVGGVEEDTPLEKKLDDLGRKLVWVVLAVAVVVAGGGILSGRAPLLMVQTAVALSVAAIPEGLPIVATIALARGMLRMARRNALVSRLAAVETLGSTDVICTDKTGTLTENRMAATRFALEGRDANRDDLQLGVSGGPLRELLEIGALCTNASLGKDGSDRVGDPLEIALLVAASEAGVDREKLLATVPRVGEESFDSDAKMMATYHSVPGNGRLVAVKGAPERVLEACDLVRTITGGDERLDKTRRAAWGRRNERLADGGLRVLAVAAKVEQGNNESPYERLTLLGLVGLADPPRDDTREAISRSRRAGIKIIMVTGDQPVTAQNIARAVGLADEEHTEVVHGADISEPEDLTQEERQRLLRARIFARVTPKQKLDLISLYQQNGSVVAMTGDGVNDAPALNKADIGIAMGLRGTQVAREAADIVLRDDAFSTITFAIEQGRIIFGNIRKFVTYLLSCNVSEILIIALASFAGAPLPLLPLQILFLNLVTDVFPALALGVGEGTSAVMDHPPRDKSEPILARRHWHAIFGYSAAITISVLAALTLALTWLDLPERGAVTVSFLTLAFAQLMHVFNMRDGSAGFLHNDVSRNPYVWLALLLCTALLVGAVHLPIFSTVLRLDTPGLLGWTIILTLAAFPLLAGEAARRVSSMRRRRFG
ncbi:MAG TPA: cation-transporting P-type ATPase [Rubrobacteraceae bacterium]|nr:cation-transporting P-type ATPase [Rubrobacteraceae bacterium]